MDRIVLTRRISNLIDNIIILSVFLAVLIFISIYPVYAVPDGDVHNKLSENPGDEECTGCHVTEHVKSFQSDLAQQNKTRLNKKDARTSMNPLAVAQADVQTLTTGVAGNITLITSLGQNWYQQGIYGPNQSNVTTDKSWGWTFFEETPPSGYITPSEKVNQRNNIYALLLDSGDNSTPITGAHVTANITYWIYDGANYTNSISQVQLIEDTDHNGFYTGSFYFYGGTPSGSCQGCHPMHGGDTNIGYFPGNYTVTITAQADNKIATNQIGFEVTPWGCEDCHGSGNPHQTKVLGLDSFCYLCHGINQIVHRGDDAGNPHQNTAHADIQCTDCHTNRSLDSDSFSGVTFIPGGIDNNKSLPQYISTTIQLNSGTHTNLTCTDCHNDLTLPSPQGGFKPDNYTIKYTINNYTPSFASIQQFQDYYIINVSSGGPLNVTLDWEGASNIGFYLYPPNFNPRNRTSPLNPDKGDYPYYNGSTFTNKPENYTNSTPLPGKWIMAVYGFNLTSYWVGMLQPPLNYTINSTYPIQQEKLPRIPECNGCHNSNATGKTFTKYQIPDWNPGFAHTDTNGDGSPDIQCRMCHDAMHSITIKDCQNCHTTAPANHPVSNPAFTWYTQSQCLACHGDPHNVTVTGGDTCIECHGTNYTGADPVAITTLVNISAFNESIHQDINATPPATLNNVDCWSCHYNKDMSRSNVKKCGACHRNPSQWHGNANVTTNLSLIW